MRLHPAGRARLGPRDFAGSLGLGGLLLDALIEVVRELGAHKVDLQVWPHNERALRLYLSRGFVVEGRIRSHHRRWSGSCGTRSSWACCWTRALLGAAPV